jgi:2-oxoacid:acceptor oxidoreductase delta subunit (pyruvate/2-ketoisovalerate family)
MKLAIAKPRTSRENKTGDWRSSRPVTDLSKCIKCAICVSVCPEGCISGPDVKKSIQERELPKTDYDYCKGCGICANECPVKCIAMVLEEK